MEREQENFSLIFFQVTVSNQALRISQDVTGRHIVRGTSALTAQPPATSRGSLESLEHQDDSHKCTTSTRQHRHALDVEQPHRRR